MNVRGFKPLRILLVCVLVYLILIASVNVLMRVPKPNSLAPNKAENTIRKFLKEQGWHVKDFQGVAQDKGSVHATAYFTAVQSNLDKPVWGTAKVLRMNTYDDIGGYVISQWVLREVDLKDVSWSANYEIK
ncbi:MAG: hypothetical protein GXY07_05665 [Candidatus Hydrogenedentes bacterium]|nr:hypothetical protein [Candidatus Hydrogenedentota bacterium]